MLSHSLLLRCLLKAVEGIDTLHQLNSIDENQADLRLALLYVSSCIPLYKQNPTWLPEQEFNLLRELILKSPDANNPSLLAELFKHLTTITDILIERIPDQNYLQALQEIIDNLPDTITSQFDTVSSGRYDIHLPTKRIKINTQTHLPSNIPRNPHDAKLSNDKKNQNIILKWLQTIQNTVLHNADLITYCGFLIDAFVQRKLSENDLISAIRKLYQQSADKELFIKIFLEEYQGCHKKNVLCNNGISIFLAKHSITLLPVLVEQLTPDQFDQLVKELFPEANSSNSIVREDEYGPQIIISFYINRESDDLRYKKAMLTYVRDHQIFSADLQKIANVMGAGLQLLPSKTLQRLPPIIQTDFYKLAEPVQRELEVFVTAFVRINEHAPKYQQRNITLFFLKHHRAIQQIIYIMGIEGIRYMRNHLAGTVLNLDRMLATMEMLPEILQVSLTIYVAQCQLTLRQHPEQINAIKTCIILLSILYKLKAHEHQAVVLLVDRFYFDFDLAKGKLPTQFQIDLTRMLLNELFQEHNQLSGNEIEQIIERYGPARLAQLATASQRMIHDQYRSIFLNLLHCDLTADNIDDFLHNTAQKNPAGKSLAQHNSFIRKRLEYYHISPTSALAYDKTHEFIVHTNADTDASTGNILLVLWTYLSKLEDEAKKVFSDSIITTDKDKNRINAILTSIDELRKIIGNKINDKKATAAILMSANAQAMLGKITANIQALKDNTAPTSLAFNEFAQHVIDQVNLYESSLFKTTRTKSNHKIDIHYFSVSQWPKQHAMTFFLGDEVGCCLATTNAQFQAMVQRRMDDAMLFHVAVDKKTGKAAALIWLYLAETTDKKIVLVSNFFEVNVKYAVNHKLRIALLNGLLRFTQHYCEDNPGISAFYMNQLSYGWYNNDLDNYPVCELSIADKLGGPLMPGAGSDQFDKENPEVQQEMKTLTMQKYYLASLKQTRFHRFDALILARNSKPNMVSKEKIINQAAFALSENTTSIEDAMNAIIAKHQLELEPFYTAPMGNDPRFASDVTTALQKAITFKMSQGGTTSPAKLILGNYECSFFKRIRNSSTMSCVNSINSKVTPRFNSAITLGN